MFVICLALGLTVFAGMALLTLACAKL